MQIRRRPPAPDPEPDDDPTTSAPTADFVDAEPAEHIDDPFESFQTFAPVEPSSFELGEPVEPEVFEPELFEPELFEPELFASAPEPPEPEPEREPEPIEPASVEPDAPVIAVQAAKPTAWESIRRFSWANLVITLVLAGAVGGSTAYAVSDLEPSYYARTVLAIDNPQEIGISVAGEPLTKLNVLRLKYASLAGTAVIVDPVASALKVPTKEVYDDLTVVASLSALLLNCESRSSDPNLSINMSIEAAKRIISYVEQEHDRNAVPPENRFTFRIVDLPTSAEKTRPTAQLIAIGGDAAGFAMAFITYPLLQIATRRRRFAKASARDL